MLFAELDLKLIAGLEVEQGGISLAHQHVAIEQHLGRVAQGASGLTFAAAVSIFEAYSLGLQQRRIEGREIQALAPILFAAHVAAAAHQLRLGDLAKLLHFGEQLTSTQHGRSVWYKQGYRTIGTRPAPMVRDADQWAMDSLSILFDLPQRTGCQGEATS